MKLIQIPEIEMACCTGCYFFRKNKNDFHNKKCSEENSLICHENKIIFSILSLKKVLKKL